MKGVFVIAVLATVFIFSCRDTTSSALKTSGSEAAKQGFYFDYIIDGREMHIDAADIVSNYYPSKHNTFTIYAGEVDSIFVITHGFPGYKKTFHYTVGRRRSEYEYFNGQCFCAGLSGKKYHMRQL